MATKIQELVYSMMVENTGRALCDSGDAYGRHWEKNSKLSIDDFIACRQAMLWLDIEGYCNAKASVFHALCALGIDDVVCEHFNTINSTDAPWDDECEFWGVNKSAAAYLRMAGLVADKRNKAGNTCNWDGNNLSQAVQYFPLVNADDDAYVLIQVHNGCDLRGGYTNAKLFRDTDGYRELWQVLQPTMYFEVEGVKIDIQGNDVVDLNGQPIDGDVLKDLASRHTEVIWGDAIYE